MDESHRSTENLCGTFAWYDRGAWLFCCSCKLLLSTSVQHSCCMCHGLFQLAVTSCRCSPEMLTEGRCSAKADIYSLGILMWEIATQVWHLA